MSKSDSKKVKKEVLGSDRYKERVFDKLILIMRINETSPADSSGISASGKKKKREIPSYTSDNGRLGYHTFPTNEQAFKAVVADAYDKQWNPRDLERRIDVRGNLWTHLESLSDERVVKIADMAFPGEEHDSVNQDLKEALVEKWYWALQVITNHASSAEQLAVSPLSLMVTRFKKSPTIQHAATTFLRDEAMHSDLFRYYLENNLGGVVIPRQDQIDSFNTLEFPLSKLTPTGTLFLGLVIEVIGGSFFEFFAQRAPDPLIRQMCKQIAEIDERRHIKFCQELYKVMQDPENRTSTGRRWEVFRNKILIDKVAQSLYKQESDPNEPLMQAVRSFGIDPKELLDYTFDRLRGELAVIEFELDQKIISKYKI